MTGGAGGWGLTDDDLETRGVGNGLETRGARGWCAETLARTNSRVLGCAGSCTPVSVEYVLVMNGLPNRLVGLQEEHSWC
jgi:hypothetical protein